MKKVKRVLIIGDGRRSKIRKISERILRLVESLVQSARVELDQRKDLSRVRADCLIILGGDGAILSAAGRMGNNQIPSVGIQMGRFGFLSELTPDDCEESIKKILKGEENRKPPKLLLSLLVTFFSRGAFSARFFRCFTPQKKGREIVFSLAFSSKRRQPSLLQRLRRRWIRLR